MVTAQKEQEKKERFLPELSAMVEAAANNEINVDNINNGWLRDLLKNFFEPPMTGLTKLKRADLLDAVKAHVVTYKLARVG